MNNQQELWWRQAGSDHDILVLLRRKDAAPCHQLHYLQMATEKLSKAFFWRAGRPPPRNHSGFTEFLRAIVSARPPKRRQQIADLFSFGRFEDVQNWMHNVLPLARALERLAPQLANDGPNPEYPWPHSNPQHVPVTFDFHIWSELTNRGHGRRLLQIIGTAVREFPSYG